MLLQKNGVDIPSYINESFIQIVLKKVFKDRSFQVQEVNFSMGSAGGDNYCSFIYRTKINVLVNRKDIKSIHLIIKSMPSDGEREIFKEMKMHLRETEMYFEMIPKLEQIADDKFSARCYYAQDEPVQTIVFEDLKQLGFRLADREKGLDEEHCAVLFKKLGKFHATSLYYAEKDPSMIKKYNLGLFNKKSLTYKFLVAVFQQNFDSLLKVVENWSGYEKILQKLKNIQNDFLLKFAENAEPSVNEIKVLNHGDLWVNNFMFKYNTDYSKHPNDVVFVDYQGSFYSSPGIDINYFLNTSVQLEVLQNHRFHILKEYYYKSLKQTLLDLKFRDIPSFDDILAEVRRKEFYGFCSAVGVLALIGMDKESSKDNKIENYSDENVAKQKSLIACSTKRFQEMMRYLLVRNDMLGLFD